MNLNRGLLARKRRAQSLTIEYIKISRIKQKITHHMKNQKNHSMIRGKKKATN